MSDPSAVPHVDLAEPYLDGALSEFKPDPDERQDEKTVRTRRQGMELEDADTCRKLDECSIRSKVPCGDSMCSCDSSACEKAKQCTFDEDEKKKRSKKFCTEVDPCKFKGSGFAEDAKTIPSCLGSDDVGTLPGRRCTVACSSHADCPNTWRCTQEGYCVQSCPDRADPSTCDTPTECEIKRIECGHSNKNCGCGKSACDKAKQYTDDEDKKDDRSKKYCNLDACKYENLSPPDGVRSGRGGKNKMSCIDGSDVGALDTSRCTMPCSRAADCPAGWSCTSDGYCAANCGQGGGSSSSKSPGAQAVSIINKIVSLVLNILTGGGIGGFELTPNPYFGLQPNLRLGLDIDWTWTPPMPTVSMHFLTELDFLAGLGLLIEFTQAVEIPPFEAEPRIPFTLVAFDVFGVQFYVTLNPFARAEFGIEATGSLKLDYKLYTTREKDNGNKKSWNETSAQWSEYKNKQKSKTGYEVPKSESPDDPVMGTYLEDDKYGVAFGFAAGNQVDCPAPYEEGEDCEIKAGGNVALVGKAAIESMFGAGIDGRIEIDSAAEIGAEVGLSIYAPSNRLFFIDPVNFLVTSYASFDPPFCGFGLDLFYRVFVGVGPIGVLGFTLLNPPFRIPLLQLQLLQADKYANDSCYVLEGENQPIQPREFDNWGSANWKDDTILCTLFRGLAQIDPKLACGAPPDPPEPKATNRCPPPCDEDQACFQGYCVDGTDEGMRISMTSGARDAELALSVTSENNQSLDVESYGPSDGSGPPLQSIVVDKPRPKPYSFKVLTGSLNQSRVQNVPYTVEIAYGGQVQERISGTIQGDSENRSFVDHELEDVPCADGHTISLGTDCGYKNRGTKTRVCKGDEWTKECRGVWYKSCKEVQDHEPNASSGVYTLDPGGEGGDSPFEAYCEMQADGGGWTLAVKADGTEGDLAFDSSRWTSSGSWRPGRPDFDHKQAKLPTFSRVSFDEIRIGFETPAKSGNWEWMTLQQSGPSLYEVFSEGSHRATSKGKNAWTNLVPGSELQSNCNREGLNVDEGDDNDDAKARIGIIGNNESNCTSPDSVVGIGIKGQGFGDTSQYSVGNFRAKDGDDAVDISSFGVVFVR